MNFKLKTPLSLIVSGLVFSALSACNNSVTTHSAVQNTASQAVIDNTEFGPTNNMQGSQAAWLSNNNWLLTSKSKGLVIADSTTQQSNIIKKGNF